MSSADSLGDRMKAYEQVSRGALVRRCPVVVRVDGRAFHSWTRSLEKPFDFGLVRWMREAAAATAAELQGAELVYAQSDEASFLLTDFARVETQPWMGYVLSKVVSLSASTFTAAFNDAARASGLRSATFDSRAFNIPFDEIANYFLWRARDWRLNSVLGLAQAHFSAKQLDGVGQEQALIMLAEKGVRWVELPQHLRCGSFFLVKERRWLSDVEPQYADVGAVVAQTMLGREGFG